MPAAFLMVELVMRLELICEDRVGISREILDCFLAKQINLSALEIQQPDRIFIKSTDLVFTELQELMTRLRLINGVCDVKTVSFLPSELERQEIQTLVSNLPDIIFSVDIKGCITLVNAPALAVLGLPETEVKGALISHFVKGFSIQSWLDSQVVSAQTKKLNLLEEDYLGDILPLMIANTGANQNEQETVLAGAVIILKSVHSIGKQFNFLKTFQSTVFDDIQAKNGYSGFGRYSESKLMNVLFTYELARRLEGTNVTANALHPGFVNTGFGMNNGGWISKILGVMQSIIAISPEKGAETNIYLASSPEVKGISGKYWDKKAQKKSSDASHDTQAQKRLWQISEDLVGMSIAQTV